jgi:multidrug resistance efflux pump
MKEKKKKKKKKAIMPFLVQSSIMCDTTTMFVIRSWHISTTMAVIRAKIWTISSGIALS